MVGAARNISFKGFLLAGILFFLSLNIFQDLLHVRRFERSLEGSFALKEKLPFSWNAWFDGTFPENASECLNERFGARNLYVKLNNQFRFSLFGIAKVRDFVVGKENYFYQQGYINEYNGAYFSGTKAVSDSVALLKQLQDQFRSLGKNLLVVLAPSKARIYPEYLPGHMVTGPTEHCHYVAYVNELKKQGIDFIDFNNWYLQKKNTSKYPVFPQFGVHWSRLEAVYAMDTILKRFSFMTKQPLPEIQINRLVELDTLQQPDDDAIRSMNLLWWPRFKKMAYPEYEVVHKERATQNLLVISDSFWWDIYGNRIPEKAFKNNEFWYYSREMYNNLSLKKTDVKDMDVKRHLLQFDNVMIICAESNLGNFGFGFVSLATKEMQRKITPTAAEVKEYREFIKTDSTWMDHIAQKAKTLDFSLDSMITLDAIYMFGVKGPMFSSGTTTVDDIIKLIKESPEWLANIKKQAAERGDNIDTAIRYNAVYVLEERKRNK